MLDQYRGGARAAIKAEAALAAIRGEDPQRLSERFGVDLAEIERWRCHLLDGAARLFEAHDPAPADPGGELGGWSPAPGGGRRARRRSRS